LKKENEGGIPANRLYLGLISRLRAASVCISASGKIPTPEFVMTAMFLVKYLSTSLIAGVLGGVAMEVVMWLISRAGLAKGDMILALGSLITKSRDNAYRVGFIVHATAAIGFGLVYTLLMITLGYTHLPKSLVLGLAVGTAQGLLVSLMLVWVVSDQHPLAEFKEADLLVGLTHFAGHVAYGGIVGLVVGSLPLV
jgi:hypothetical protein